MAFFIWIHFYVEDPNARRRVKVRDLEMVTRVQEWNVSTTQYCTYIDDYEVCTFCRAYDITNEGETIGSTYGCFSMDYVYYQK